MRALYRALLVLVLVSACTLYTALMVRRQPRRCRPSFRAWRQTKTARLVCRSVGFRVTTQGEVPRGIAMLYVCNHLTGLDPVLIASQVPVSFAGKASIAGWPVLGWVCRTYGMLLVDRSRPFATRKLVSEIHGRFSSGVSLLVFPEGTTNWGNEVGPFKTGAFESVAGRRGAAVLPIFLDVTAIDGTTRRGGAGRHQLSHNHHATLVRHLLHVLSFRTVHFNLHIGVPIDGGELDRKQLAQQAHCAVGTLAAGT